MNEDDGIEIDDLLSLNNKVKSKVDGKKKGNRTELQLCKLLTKHFGVDFNRSVGSGNRWGQVALSQQAMQVFSGDICVPEGFDWVFECKGGYDSVDLATSFSGGVAQIDKFIEQSSHDAINCNRKPIICWKRNRRDWLAIIRVKDMTEELENKFPYRLYYRDWIMISLEELLKNTEKDFWFKK